jgi:AraC family transcriptional regulator of adaptative response/methylated-DNA-[protein]-cysteine methyltransferase
MAGDSIAVTVRPSSLGTVLVARSAQGVCAILLGDDPDLLRRDLQRRFPDAALRAADQELDGTASAVVALIEAPAARRLDVELDLRGTTFQRRVWHALREIPAGSTATYSEIAERIGAPGSARAVAVACAANPLAVAVPCHRVIRNDGGLSGYRWGVERKKALLEREVA